MPFLTIKTKMEHQNIIFFLGLIDRYKKKDIPLDIFTPEHKDYLILHEYIELGEDGYFLTKKGRKYLNKNETLDTYQTLVLIEFIKGDFQLDEVINQKVAELDFLKKTNPIVHYQVYENNGEYILDFLISQNSEDVEKILIAERNVYRYKLISEGENKINPNDRWECCFCEYKSLIEQHFFICNKLNRYGILMLTK